MSRPTPTVQTHNVMREDFGWEVPVETVPVPSEGRVYDPDSSIYNKKVLEIRAMTAQEEDILTSRALLQQGTVITHLIRSCLIDKSVNVNEMLLGDRNAVMVSIRITGYGSRYSGDVSCPECGTSSLQHFDLSSLAIKRLGIEPAVEGKNIFEYTLPVTKKSVHFKFLTGQDEIDRSAMIDRRRKLMPDIKIDNSVTSRLEQVIVSVDGITDRNKISNFIKNMPAQDSRKLRAFINQNEPGIDMNCDMNCPHCGQGSEVALPMGVNFLWPRD